MMKLLRYILFPIVPIYFLVTWLRNKLYDKGIKPSQGYDFPVICVGNLSTGGTGKTPMIEYLVRLLKSEKNVATLSRGYKRVTSGFLLADDNANADTIGDEPFQFFTKFKSIKVAVEENRQNGIDQLRQLPNPPEVILLDDAYQHRKVEAGLTILLTSFEAPYFKDMVLPTGNLREPKSGANRADIIVVTKCPYNLDEITKQKFRKHIAPNLHQNLFFSGITYSAFVYSQNDEKPIEDFDDFTLVTGIANAQPLVRFLETKKKNFTHLEFGDHYNFRTKDIEILEQKRLLLTTEKDFMRLSAYESLLPKLYYIPIEITIDQAEAFDKLILDFTN